jgi:hypothetical protein
MQKLLATMGAQNRPLPREIPKTPAELRLIEVSKFLVPLEGIYELCDDRPKRRLEYLSDGIYLMLSNRPQRRFVRLAPGNGKVS